MNIKLHCLFGLDGMICVSSCRYAASCYVRLVLPLQIYSLCTSSYTQVHPTVSFKTQCVRLKNVVELDNLLYAYRETICCKGTYQIYNAIRTCSNTGHQNTYSNTGCLFLSVFGSKL